LGGYGLINNRLKKKMKNGEAAVGTFAVLNSPDMIEILGITGFDFVILDCEHGPVSVENTVNLIRAAELRGITPIVRIPNAMESTILHVLDVGAHGIQVPQVNDVETAKKIVKYSKYSPEGNRGVVFPRASDYGLTDLAGYFSHENKETMIVTHCENIECLKNLDEICEIPEIDVIFVGPYDMSQSLGVTGQVTHDSVENAIQKALEITKRHGKACGIFAGCGETAKIRVEQGFQYVAIGLDISLFGAKCRQEIEAFRG
jgi:4-hydroxy-2-oxoheptanedioate aldolase